MSINFDQIKIQRALRHLTLSKHPLYMEIPYDPNEKPGVNDVHVQLRSDLPANQQPAAQTVRNGSIYMKSRDVPGKRIQPGMVLLLNLARAAAVLADDTYEVATVDDIERELKRQDAYRKDMAETDRRLRMNSSGVENNITVQQPAAPVNVTIAWPEGMELVPKRQPVDADAEEDKPRRRGRARSQSTPEPETADPAAGDE